MPVKRIALIALKSGSGRDKGDFFEVKRHDPQLLFLLNAKKARLAKKDEIAKAAAKAKAEGKSAPITKPEDADTAARAIDEFAAAAQARAKSREMSPARSGRDDHEKAAKREAIKRDRRQREAEAKDAKEKAEAEATKKADDPSKAISAEEAEKLKREYEASMKAGGSPQQPGGTNTNDGASGGAKPNDGNAGNKGAAGGNGAAG